MEHRFAMLMAGMAGVCFASATVQVFDDPVGICYGDTNAIAPMKAGALPVDYDRDGTVDLVSDGWWWKDSGEKDGTMPIYERGGKAGMPSNPADLDGDEFDDTVILKGRKFIWMEDTTVSGDGRNFVERGALQFVLGDDLLLPDGAGTDEMTPQWKIACLADYDNDGRTDILLTKYMPELLDGDINYVPWEYAGYGIGWIDNRWIFSDLSTSLWICRNVGTGQKPAFTFPRMVTCGQEKQSIVYPTRSVSATLIDWNCDGKMDLFTQVQDCSLVYLNAGTFENGEPLFENGRRIVYGDSVNTGHRKIAAPWRDAGGLLHIAFNGGSVVYESVQEQASDLWAFSELHWVLFKNPTTMKMDIFAVPDVADLNGDGRHDLIVGSECGYLWYYENLDPTGGIKKWSTPKLLEADGKPIRMFEENNMQGPEELLIGYSNPTAEDWDLDGDIDLLVGNHGEIIYRFENVGSATNPLFTARGTLKYGSDNRETVRCAWRARPGVGDMNGDGLPDLVTVSPDRKLHVWLRGRDDQGRLFLRAGKDAVDRDGYSFNVCRDSRGIGRSKHCVVDWDRDGLMDIVTSPGTSVGARTECVYYYKNLGMTDDGKVILEFRPNQIKVVGQTKKGRFTHYRMVEPVDWDGDGSWEAVAGIDGRNPVIPDTWLFFWPQLKEEPQTCEDVQFSVHESNVGPFAILKPAVGGGEVAELKAGEKVFRNRGCVLNELPEALNGMHFIRPDIETSFSVCEKAGLVYALVPPADGPRRNCYIDYMKSIGFKFSPIEPFQLFGADTLNRVAVMQKQLEKGNKLVLGSWALVVFK